MSSYEKRVIAFIDILGAKELLKDEQKKLLLLALIKKFSTYCSTGKIEEVDNNPLNTTLVGAFFKGEKTTRLCFFDIAAFSDHIVISFPYFENPEELESAFDGLFWLIGWLHYQAFRKQILLRGAITCGDLYHQGSIITGQGLVDAYTLEEKCAVYPRTIITDELYSILKASKSYFLRSEDQLYYIDWMWHLSEEIIQHSECEGEEPSGEYRLDEEEADGTKKWICNNIKALNSNISAITKWRWLANHYNFNIQKYNHDRKYDHLLVELEV